MTNQHSFFNRPRLWGLLGGLTLAVAQFFSPAGGMGTAQAAPTCTNSGQTVTCTYPFTGAPESWTVPAGVTQATFQLVGAPGGRSGGQSFPHADGGRGADLRATLPLAPGADVVITVGGPGGTDGRETAGFNGGGGGRFVGNSYPLAGGGGGATDIRIGGTALTDRVLVAGGGGGGGGYGEGSGTGGSGGSAGGVGGDADMSGFSAPADGSLNGGGGGASGNIGGQGGAAGGGFNSDPGGNGSLGQGGAVADGSFGVGYGGGGGGGNVGGGGGGSGGENSAEGLSSGGGGGGGGSSFASASASNVTLTTDTTKVPKVVITYVDTIAPSVTINQAAGQADPTSSNPVLFSANFSEPVTGFTAQDVTLSGTANLSSASVTVSGGPSSYTISVAGLAGNGTVIATIGANRVSDLGGNGNGASTSTDNIVTVNFDSTAPVITPSVAGTLGSNGWYVSNVTVSWSVVDNESTVSSQSGCATQNITSDTAGVTFTCSASSAGGSNSQSVTIKRDATPPTITLVNRTAANSNGWNNSDVTVSWSCSDATSGVVAASVSQTVSNEGANQTATGACTDNAGNSASNTQSGINIDQTAPTISAAATTNPNPAGWYNHDVTVHFTCADNLSGVTSCPANETLSSEGTAVNSTAQTITDLAGNSSAASNVVTVKIDKSAPTISATALTAPNANGWYNSNVTVRFTCVDGLAGVASCPADEILSSEGSAVNSTAQTTSDLAGNSSAASNVVTVQIDKTVPVVTVTGVSNGAIYTLGSVPTAGCSTTDALSGVATQATLSVTGGNPDGTGSFTATCSGATDNAGNNSSASVTYSVAYNWTGFFQPVDNLPTVNTVNAGSGIPVKFSLGGDYGLNIFTSGYPVSQNVSCGSGGSGSSDPIEETVTAGNSGLQYDAATQTYTYVWKTDKAWAGTCRQLLVKLIDGTEHIALFQFNGKGRSAEAGESNEGEAVVRQLLFLPLVNHQ